MTGRRRGFYAAITMRRLPRTWKRDHVGRSPALQSPPVSSDDDRPPICPACGVTMFIVVEDDKTHFVCVECGFSEDD